MKSYDIVTIEQGFEDVLCNPAQEVPFPLSAEHRDIIMAMMAKFEDENMAGLAAPQVGEPWRIILFHVDEVAYKYRDNVEKKVPLTVLINPSYEPIEEDGTHYDWEACFSVETRMGKPERYNTIRYRGQTPDGEWIEGVAKGFQARLMQHEIDHVDGRLFLTRLKEDDVQGTREELMEIRMAEIEAKEG